MGARCVHHRILLHIGSARGGVPGLAAAIAWVCLLLSGSVRAHASAAHRSVWWRTATSLTPGPRRPACIAGRLYCITCTFRRRKRMPCARCSRPRRVGRPLNRGRARAQTEAAGVGVDAAGAGAQLGPRFCAILPPRPPPPSTAVWGIITTASAAAAAPPFPMPRVGKHSAFVPPRARAGGCHVEGGWWMYTRPIHSPTLRWAARWQERRARTSGAPGVLLRSARGCARLTWAAAGT